MGLDSVLGKCLNIGSYADDAAAVAFLTSESWGSPRTGLEYFNTTTGRKRVYGGSSWDEQTTTAAAFLTTPTAIATDDTVTIADGQQAVVESLEVNGTLKINGTMVFV